MKLFRQLLADAPDDDGLPEHGDGPVKISAEEARRQTRKELFERQKQKIDADMAENLRMSRLRAQMKQEVKFETMVRKIGEGKDMTDSIDKFLTVTDSAEVTKKEALFNDWESSVFDPLQASVNRRIESIDRKSLTKRKNKEFQKFLHASNNPSGVFLDTVFEGDTEPAKATSVKASMGKIRDPVRRSLLKYREETSLGKEKQVSYAPKERDMLNTTQWNDGKIQATPYGHFAHFVGKEHNPTPMQKKITQSDVIFDNFSFPTDGYKSTNVFQGGKRVYSDQGNFHEQIYTQDGPWREK